MTPIKLSIILSAMAVAACGTSSPARYYGLVPVESSAAYEVADEFAVIVGPMRVAEYLNRSQIVTRDDGVSLDVADFDRWSEPLSRSFQRTVTDNIAILLGSDRVLDFPAYAEIDSGYFLPAQVTRFDAESGGTAVLEIQWIIRDKKDVILMPARRSRYETTVARPGDYDSIVSALSELIGQFSRDAAARLAELP